MNEQLGEINVLVDKTTGFFVEYSFQVLGAILILVIGSIVGKWLAKLVMKVCQKKNVDVTLTGFIGSIVKGIVVIFAVIIALGKFGITISPMIAALGAIAFGATYAIQGPLSNYGAGIAIILGRPFVVGDTIQVAKVFGIVTEVKLAYTTLTDEDGVMITIPNKHVVGEILQNSQEFRIVEGVVGISYKDDPEVGIKAISGALSDFEEVTQTPKPQVGIKEFGESSIHLDYRYWVPTQKYFQTMHAVNLTIYKAIKKAGITIPYPQRDVHMVDKA